VIFVAVGTTDFDALIAEMDRLAPSLEEEVIMQIGNSRYVPKSAAYFRFAPTLAPYYDRCHVVVAHGGLGIITEALERGKKVIGVENVDAHGRHQRDLLRTLAQQGYIIWCQDPRELSEALGRVQTQKFRRYVVPRCEIHTQIIQFLRRLEKTESKTGARDIS
jgi:UDP-N-acetylglucosamine transferase subunit ALG13